MANAFIAESEFRIVLFTYGVHRIDHQYRAFGVGLLKILSATFCPNFDKIPVIYLHI